MITPKILPVNRVMLMMALKKFLGDVDTVVEIGTYQGEYANIMCMALKPEKFYAVDPFHYIEGMDTPDVNLYCNQTSLDVFAEEVKTYLSTINEGRTSELIRKYSNQAAHDFADGSIDVVYIDGAHDYEAVKEDIALWFPKVKDGGVLCGHDYTGRSHLHEFGVIPAVQEFLKANDLQFSITNEPDFPSWVVRKDLNGGV
jgi:predicted O-methyltransferase YrrM